MKISFEKKKKSAVLRLWVYINCFSPCFFFHLKLHFLGRGVFHSGLPWPLSAPCRWPAGPWGRSGSGQPFPQWKLWRSCWRHRHLEVLASNIVHIPDLPSGFGAMGGGAGAGPLLQGPPAPGKSCLAELIRVFSAATSTEGLCQRAISCCSGALGAAAGHWASEKPFGMYPTSWAIWLWDFECEMQPSVWRMRNVS